MSLYPLDHGAFRINDRLFPEKIEHKFKTNHDRAMFLNGPNYNLSENEPPVKISIPHSRIHPPEPAPIPHRRVSYEPLDSVKLEKVSFVCLFSSTFTKGMNTALDQHQNQQVFLLEMKYKQI